MIQAPIYKDTFYAFTSDDVRFRINIDGSSIYEGRAKARPGEDYAKICLNKICQNYLNDSLEGVDFTISGTIVHSEAVKDFELTEYSEQSSGWVTSETYRFFYDWDNEKEINLTGMTMLSIPVNQHYSDNQIIPSTTYNAVTGSVVTAIRYRDNSEPLYCGDFSLFYRNLAGGWDSFLFEGKSHKSEGFNYQQMEKNYTNNPSSGYEFGKITYLNEITHKWDLTTGYLSDSEGEIFVKQLCSSTECYLQDLRKGLIYPVVITDTEIKYKKYLEDGNEPIYFTLKVESSQKNIEF